MAKARTVFVIGAGAGVDVNMPLGNNLRHKIASVLRIKYNDIKCRLEGDQQIVDALTKHITQVRGESNPSDFLKACEQIVQAMPIVESIDNFVDMHRNDPKITFCAKLAIVRCILAANERNSALYYDKRDPDSRLDTLALENTWYTSFLRLLCRNSQFQGIAERLKRITFVIFNYDRCVETFLFEGLQIAYPETPETVAEVLNAANFIHPYEVVGPLHWQDSRGSEYPN